jgi:hypothetical protein
MYFYICFHFTTQASSLLLSEALLARYVMQDNIKPQLLLPRVAILLLGFSLLLPALLPQTHVHPEPIPIPIRIKSVFLVTLVHILVVEDRKEQQRAHRVPVEAIKTRRDNLPAETAR